MAPATGSVEDAELVRRTLAGEHQAFRTLMERHHGRIYAIALAHLGDFDAADDLAQEVFVRVYLHLEQLQHPQHLSTWLLCAARNLSRDWLRMRQSHSRLLPMLNMSDIPEAEVPAASPRERAQATEASQKLLTALASLPADLREVVLLHYTCQITQSEIARTLGVNPSTVGRQLHRALRKLEQGIRNAPALAFASATPKEMSTKKAQATIAALLALSPSARARIADHTTPLSLAGPMEGLEAMASQKGTITEHVTEFLNYSSSAFAAKALVTLSAVAFCTLLLVIAGNGSVQEQGAGKETKRSTIIHPQTTGRTPAIATLLRSSASPGSAYGSAGTSTPRQAALRNNQPKVAAAGDPPAATGILFGTVIDAHTSQPIIEYTVSGSINNDMLERDPTQPGHFTVRDLLPLDNYEVRIEAPGYAFYRSEHFPVYADQPTTRTFAVGVGGSIVGALVDGATSSPVPTAIVEAFHSQSADGLVTSNQKSDASAVSDSEGNFVLGNLPAGYHLIRVQRSGSAVPLTRVVETRLDEVKDVGQIVVGSGEAIRGRLLRVHGNLGIPGARIQVMSLSDPDHPVEEALTDEAGSFVMNGLPNGTATVIAPEYALELWCSIGSDKDSEVRLQLGSARVHGQVTHLGQPMKAEVAVANVSTRQMFKANTDDNGYYDLRHLPAGEQMLLLMVQDPRFELPQEKIILLPTSDLQKDFQLNFARPPSAETGQ